MRAVVVSDEHRLEVREVTDAGCSPGGVLVRVGGCGICGSDLHMVEAKLIMPGSIMGHEAAGTVESVGDGVEGLQPGDHVAIHPFDPCGTCPSCLSGATQRCQTLAMTTIGLGYRPGAFAELIEVAPGMLHKLPASLPVELGAIAEPLAVALHGFRRSRYERGMRVGVIGCGPIGLCAVLIARTLGADRVWAADRTAFRAELAGRLGADEYGPSPKDADLVIECAGAPGTIDLAVSSAHGGGQVVVLAVNIKGDTVYPFTWVTKEVELVPCLGYTKDEYDEAAEMIATGRVDVAPMITRRASFEEADEAFFALLDGASEGKVLITPG